MATQRELYRAPPGGIQDKLTSQDGGSTALFTGERTYARHSLQFTARGLLWDVWKSQIRSDV